jgi:YggT family protein
LTWPATAALVEALARYAVLTGVAGALVVFVTSWAVRHGHLQPFAPLPRAVRRVSDPVLRPLERRLVRWGRNPQDAPLWLTGITIVGGILLLSVLSWLTGWIDQLLGLAGASPRAWARWLVNTAFQLVLLALIVRVVASWFGHGPYTRWLRPAYLLTDWLVNPIRRFLPPFGMIDLSPLVAYVVLILLRGVLLGLLL